MTPCCMVGDTDTDKKRLYIMKDSRRRDPSILYIDSVGEIDLTKKSSSLQPIIGSQKLPSCLTLPPVGTALKETQHL